VCTDDQWLALVDLMGRPPWTEDDRFGTVVGRRAGADDIDRRLQDWFFGQDLCCAVESLAGAGIPAAPVVSPSLVTENPQLTDRKFLEQLDHPRTGPGRYPRPPFAPLDGRRNWLMRPPPTLGEHNGEVLRDLCGLTDQDLARLASAGVIGTRPKGL
jgi:crotonobetainyl-CoA:carnitine CoA-transferase CaiB-like acyl-CoA transferase